MVENAQKLLDEKPYEDEKTWDDFGFLNGLEGDKKHQCAKEFGKAMEYLLIYENKLELLMFPVIRRIIERGWDKEFDMQVLANTILETYTYVEADDRCKDESVDVDAEVAALSSERYMEKYS